MRKTVILLVLVALVLPSLGACKPVSEALGYVVCAGEKYNIASLNGGKGNSLYDRSYAPDGVPSVSFTAAGDGSAVVFGFADGNTVGEGTVITVTKGEKVNIPTNGFVFFTEKKLSAATASIEGYETIPEYRDFAAHASVTSLDGSLGVTLSHKDVGDLSGCGNVLIQPSTGNDLSVPDTAYAVLATRNIDGTFRVEEVGIGKASKRDFTLIFTDPYSVDFAKKVLTTGADFCLLNSSLITEYGDTPTVVVGSEPFTGVVLNAAAEQGDGTYVYDDDSPRLVTPARDGEYVNMIVCDGIVAEIGKQGENLIIPHPMGTVLSFVGSANVAKASGIKVGDTVEEYLFESVTTSVEYVLIKDKYAVEVNYRNVSRTAYSKAVIYDDNSTYTTTRTNVWGAELAISDGIVTEVKPATLETSGNTAIPDGGYVLSLGMNHKYYSALNLMKAGATAEYIKKESLYTWRSVDDVTFNTAAEGEYFTVFDSSFGSTAPAGTNVHDYIADANGYIVGEGKANGITPIPEGGYVIRATGGKYNEFSGFYRLGMKLIIPKDSTTVYFLGLPRVSRAYYSSKLDTIEENIEYWAGRLETLDYAALAEKVAQARGYIDGAVKSDEGTENLKKAFSIIDELYFLSMPSALVQNRAAWLANTVTDEAQVKQIIDYAVKIGLNTIIVDVFNDQYTIYDTKVAHLQKLASLGEFDALEAFVRLGHEAGLDVYAMQCAFSCGHTADGYDSDHFVSYFKDKMLISKRGRNVAYYYDTTFYTLNPNDAEIRAFLLSVYEELLENYDIDGLQLDYIRFPLPSVFGTNYEDMGYNDDIVAAYRAWSGSKSDPKTLSINSDEWSKWCEFRRDLVTSFVSQVHELVEATADDVMFTVTCFPDYNDRQLYTYQDVEKWANLGIVDGIYPMSYTAVYEDELKYNSSIKEAIGDNAFLTMGLGTYDGATQDCLARQIALTQLLSTDGTSIFALPYINSGEYYNFYSEGVYREKAVKTNKYGLTLAAGIDELMLASEKVYPYLYKDADVSSLKEAMTEIREKYCGSDVASGTEAEKEKWCNDVISALESAKSGAGTGVEKVDGNIAERIDRIIGYIRRTLNTLK